MTAPDQLNETLLLEVEEEQRVRIEDLERSMSKETTKSMSQNR